MNKYSITWDKALPCPASAARLTPEKSYGPPVTQAPSQPRLTIQPSPTPRWRSQVTPHDRHFRPCRLGFSSSPQAFQLLRGLPAHFRFAPQERLNILGSEMPPLHLAGNRLRPGRQRNGAGVIDGCDQLPQDRDVACPPCLHSRAQIELQPLAQSLRCISLPNRIHDYFPGCPRTAVHEISWSVCRTTSWASFKSTKWAWITPFKPPSPASLPVESIWMVK